jgi:hypothetical protein
VASTLNNLAGLCQDQGKNAEAEELAERAKEIRSKYQ